MAKIFSVSARVGVGRVVEPVARGLLRTGFTPNAVTVLGTVGVLGGALLGARGWLLAAAAVVTLFALTDVVDGTMARLRGGSTRFGALLDSSLDRVADGAVFGAVAFWAAGQGDDLALVAALVCLAGGQVVSYVKARAEGLGLRCDVGIAERFERLVLVGIGAVLTDGVGLPWGMAAALCLLGVLTVVTIGQRILAARAEAPPP
ncbi:putative phosphatidylinositol synthase PgsA [Pilimelia terevasa]|uniref:Phosphatidylinositol phosphate synthase n=1 Tax=Pilimelia terevasa TaxID=53372 RepID=A0A8J3BMQ0_9ACTN|nr:CDP-alcohol phosphatidyltransferase family protein [Pilimelia terevasa]GGK25606.1 putative phosphatidylinositol synthase PgsA [Pilimelia terevasa]